MQTNQSNAIQIESKVDVQPDRKHRSPLQLSLRRFMKNKLAISWYYCLICNYL